MPYQLVLGAIGALLIAACAPANEPQTCIMHDDSDLQTMVDCIHALGVPGALAEAIIGEKRVVARSGVIDLVTRAPVPMDAHFRIASNTKTFVAVVVLQLVGEGKLSLDDTVEQWLPQLVSGNGNDGRRITLRNLLQHSSGLIDYTGDLPIRSAADWERERLRTYLPEELVRMSMQHSPDWLPEQDEKRFSYSNVNFVLAGMIIEKVTGRHWEQEIHERIVLPLQLRGTSAPGTGASLPEPHARSYAQFGPDEPMVDTTQFNPTLVGASGAVISTTSDLNTFLRALVAGKLLHPEQLAQMQKTIEADDLYDRFPGARYGLGLIWSPLSCGGGYWSHVGDGAAGATRNGVTPDGRNSVVVFMAAQLTSPDLHQQQERLAAAMIDRVLCAES